MIFSYLFSKNAAQASISKVSEVGPFGVNPDLVTGLAAIFFAVCQSFVGQPHEYGGALQIPASLPPLPPPTCTPTSPPSKTSLNSSQGSPYGLVTLSVLVILSMIGTAVIISKRVNSAEAGAGSDSPSGDNYYGIENGSGNESDDINPDDDSPTDGSEHFNNGEKNGNSSGNEDSGDDDDSDYADNLDDDDYDDEETTDDDNEDCEPENQFWNEESDYDDDDDEYDDPPDDPPPPSSNTDTPDDDIPLSSSRLSIYLNWLAGLCNVLLGTLITGVLRKRALAGLLGELRRMRKSLRTALVDVQEVPLVPVPVNANNTSLVPSDPLSLSVEVEPQSLPGVEKPVEMFVVENQEEDTTIESVKKVIMGLTGWIVTAKIMDGLRRTHATVLAAGTTIMADDTFVEIADDDEELSVDPATVTLSEDHEDDFNISLIPDVGENEFDITLYVPLPDDHKDDFDMSLWVPIPDVDESEFDTTLYITLQEDHEDDLSLWVPLPDVNESELDATLYVPLPEDHEDDFNLSLWIPLPTEDGDAFDVPAPVEPAPAMVQLNASVTASPPLPAAEGTAFDEPAPVEHAPVAVQLDGSIPAPIPLDVNTIDKPAPVEHAPVAVQLNASTPVFVRPPLKLNPDVAPFTPRRPQQPSPSTRLFTPRPPFQPNAHASSSRGMYMQPVPQQPPQSIMYVMPPPPMVPMPYFIPPFTSTPMPVIQQAPVHFSPCGPPMRQAFNPNAGATTPCPPRKWQLENMMRPYESPGGRLGSPPRPVSISQPSRSFLERERIGKERKARTRAPEQPKAAENNRRERQKRRWKEFCDRKGFIHYPSLEVPEPENDSPTEVQQPEAIGTVEESPKPKRRARAATGSWVERYTPVFVDMCGDIGKLKPSASS